MAPAAAATGAQDPELARFDARTVQADIDSLLSHDDGAVRFGTVSLLRKLQTGAADCVDVLSKPRGADALVAALQAGGRYAGEVSAASLRCWCALHAGASGHAPCALFVLQRMQHCVYTESVHRQVGRLIRQGGTSSFDLNFRMIACAAPMENALMCGRAV